MELEEQGIKAPRERKSGVYWSISNDGDSVSNCEEVPIFEHDFDLKHQPRVVEEYRRNDELS